VSTPSWRLDKRSAAARGYDAKWRKRRAQQLTLHPLCCMCERRGKVKAATVADHITPHRGDPVLFQGPLQSLCQSCHSGDKQTIEHGKEAPRQIGADGFPIALDGVEFTGGPGGW
jgi:5-methylcytosine-specific restriction protein A